MYGREALPAFTSTAPTCRAPQGAGSNYMNLFAEPDDHAVGRSRGGLSTKIHALVDGKGRPLVLLVAPGQGGDAPMFAHLPHAVGVANVRKFALPPGQAPAWVTPSEAGSGFAELARALLAAR